MRRVFLVAALSVACQTGFAEACEPGRYAGAATPNDERPPFPVVISIQCQRDVVGGQVESPFGTSPIANGQASADAFRVEADMGGPRLVVEARRSGEAWTGRFSAGPRSGTVALTRNDTATLETAIPAPPERIDLSDEEWAQDLGFIEGEISSRHANAFHTISEGAWYEAVDDVRGRIVSLSDAEIAIALRQLVARIGDAHTSVSFPSGVERLPLGFFWFGDDLRIVRTSERYRGLLGARVVGVGGAPLAEAYARVATLFPPENEAAVRAFPPYVLGRRDVMRYFGLAQGDRPVSLEVVLANGRRQTVEVAFAPRLEAAEWRYVGGQPPLWSERPNESLFWRELDGNVLYVNFRAYDTLRQVGRDLVAEIDRMQPAKLIIDMRDNGGGDFNMFRRSLLQAIQERPWLNQSDRLYVLIGREMFSAAMTNAADLQLQTNATLVGEAIGERPNSYQEVVSMPLPNSRLRLGVSTRFYEALPGQGNPEAVTPDVSCPPTWENFSHGRDDALMCVLDRR